MLPMAVARSSSMRRCDTLCISGLADDIMFLFYSGPYIGRPMNFATTDRFRLNLLIYRNVGQNSVS